MQISLSLFMECCCNVRWWFTPDPTIILNCWPIHSSNASKAFVFVSSQLRSEFNENSPPRKFSWESVSFFLARPWVMIFISLETREQQYVISFSSWNMRIAPSLDSESEILNPTQLQGCRAGNLETKWYNFWKNNKKHSKISLMPIGRKVVGAGWSRICMHNSEAVEVW